MDKILELSLLYDFYAPLLTDKQKLFFEMYNLDDLSLNEIAEQYDISPQAVRDLLKRTEKILKGYEEKLNLIEKYRLQKDNIKYINKYIEDNLDSSKSLELKEMLNQLLE